MRGGRLIAVSAFIVLRNPLVDELLDRLDRLAADELLPSPAFADAMEHHDLRHGPAAGNLVGKLAI